MAEDNGSNSYIQTYALRFRNVENEPITGIQLLGVNSTNNHAKIMGAVFGFKNVNTTTFSSSEWTSLTVSGQSSWTPSNGNTTNRSYWITDEVTFTSALPISSNCVVRVTLSAGNYSYPSNGTTTSRQNTGDMFTGVAITSGDYGSTSANATINPTWAGNLAIMPFGVCIKRSGTERDLHAAFGDSVIAGSGSESRDRWLYKLNSQLTTKHVTSFGRGGMTVQDYCTLFRNWLINSPIKSKFKSASISGWSWNNQDSNATDMINAVNQAVSDGEAAGLRMSVWFPTPAGLQTGGYGNITTRTNTLSAAIANGHRVVDTSGPITNVNGIDIIGTYSSDNVHLNDAGQDSMGNELFARYSIIFG